MELFITATKNVTVRVILLGVNINMESGLNIRLNMMPINRLE